MEGQGVYVEIVAKKKGCMLCDLAIGILEEICMIALGETKASYHFTPL